MPQTGLEKDTVRLPMAERLIAAASRADAAKKRGEFGKSNTVLRRDQNDVYLDFMDYAMDVATRSPQNADPPYGRIIQPPRTGKTVIASQLIAGTGLESLFLVPSRMLVEQAAEEFRMRLPGIPIGLFYSDQKNLVEHGINVATYQSVQKLWRTKKLPHVLQRAALVFADEGHQAMTLLRQSLLKHAFDPLALRIALTATPDYDEERALCRYFPDLIHEITFEEAIRLDLLAPYRFWLAEVDVSGSKVRVRFGDYIEEDVERVMTEAPFFRAVESYRYMGKNRGKPALICCATRRQAAELRDYLLKHRPKGTTKPRLVLGTTPGRTRAKVLRDFEGGRFDTLINVGVLTQGWNSPRCKLLLDISPSLSRVRAMQKFSRVLTRNGNQEARIIAFVPKELPVLPALPIELFAESLETYQTGTLVGRKSHGSTSDEDAADAERLRSTPIKDVKLKSRFVYTTGGKTHQLDVNDTAAWRRVVESCPEFDPSKPPAFLRFRWLQFQHQLFTGRGLELLRHLKYRLSCHGYFAFLQRLYPEGAAWRLLLRGRRYESWENEEASCSQDAKHFLEVLNTPTKDGKPNEAFKGCVRALTGLYEPNENPEQTAIDRDTAREIRHALSTLRPERERFLRAFFGLDEENERTYKEIGDEVGLSRQRTRQICEEAICELRHPSRTARIAPEGEEEYRIKHRPFR